MLNGGHYKLLQRLPDRVAVQCVACHHTSPGWAVTPDPRLVGPPCCVCGQRERPDQQSALVAGPQRFVMCSVNHVPDSWAVIKGEQPLHQSARPMTDAEWIQWTDAQRPVMSVGVV